MKCSPNFQFQCVLSGLLEQVASNRVIASRGRSVTVLPARVAGDVPKAGPVSPAKVS